MNAKRIHDAKTIHGRAARLLARHTDMGFTKDGKPMVIDQAFELVAAEEGYRNQHELRAAATKRGNGVVAAGGIFARGVAEAGDTPAVDPQVTEQAEKLGRSQWHDACNRMGWNRDSEIVHLEGFLAQKGLMAEFGAYAQTVALEEEGFDAEVRNPAREVLESVGYSVQDSEFGKPYWSFEQADEDSTDFPNEAAAWDDAWRDAQERVLPKSRMTRDTWDELSAEQRFAVVRLHLGTTLETVLRNAANEAYENYNFGEHLSVAGDDGWLFSSDNLVSRTVFLSDDRQPDADSVRYRFTVEVVDGQVVSTSLTKLNQALFGR
jgi:hypothetical protein